MDFSVLANPEETFFQHGYADGYAHGRIHGLIEGRTVGKEKGFEIWEEVGYYRGFALLWKTVYDRKEQEQGGGNSSLESRAMNHIQFILSAIDKFPLVNPSTIVPSSTEEEDAEGGGGDGRGEEVDITKLLSQIRSRYKALCAILGVKPRLRTLVSGEEEIHSESDLLGAIGGKKSSHGDIETGSNKNKIWRIDQLAKPDPLIY